MRTKAKKRFNNNLFNKYFINARWTKYKKISSSLIPPHVDTRGKARDIKRFSLSRTVSLTRAFLAREEEGEDDLITTR